MAKTGSNIYKRKDGRYEGRILTGHNIYQKPQYTYVYGRTLREVKEKMKKVKEGRQKAFCGHGLYLEICSEEWLTQKKEEWKSTTYDTYRRLIYGYIIPILGNYRVSDISPEVLEEFCREIEKKSGREQLSACYKKYICSLVCQIITFAEEQHHLELKIPKTPALRVQRNEMELPDEEQLQNLEEYLLQHLENDTCLGILLAMYTGIRIGELCALQWKDISLAGGTVTIRRNLQRIQSYGETDSRQNKTKICVQMPKTVKSVRVIPLADRLLHILKEHEKRPEEYIVSGKRREWAEVRTMQYRFKAILKECVETPFHFHLLRHAFASRCIGQGCDVKSLSEIMGHSSIQITMNIYVHSSMKQKKDMVNLICGMGG